MSLPDVTISIQDGNLGLAALAANGQQTPALIGASSLGTPATVYSFGDLTTLHTTLGEGPLVEAAALVLAIAGGPVFCVPITQTDAGASGDVTQVGTGTSVMTVSTGTAYDTYNVIISITKAAASLAGLGQAQASFDGGITQGPVFTIPSNGIVALNAAAAGADTGLTVTFAAGSLVAGDTYSFTTTAPYGSTSDLSAAVTALDATTDQYFAVMTTTPAASGSAAATWAAELDTLLTAAATAYRFAGGITSGGTDTDANFETAFAAFASKRVGVPLGFANMVSPLNGRQISRSAAWAVLARLCAISPGEDAGAIRDGSLQGVTALQRDERLTPGGDAAGFITLRSHIGLTGYYATRARIFAGVASDFQFFQYRRVMDIGCTVARTTLMQFLLSSVRVNSNGTILEQDARVIENMVGAALNGALVQTGDADSVSVLVNRSANVLSTQTIPVTITILPLGYAAQLTVTIGFTNPSVSVG